MNDLNFYEIIRPVIDIVTCVPIQRGYSDDEKYLCTSGTHEKYLVRIRKSDDIKVINAGKEEFNLIKQLRKYSTRIPEPLFFWISEDRRYSVMILSYIDGQDGEESLISLGADIQYQIGWQAGEELKKLHNLAAPAGFQEWSLLKWRKYEWYWNEYQKKPFDTVNFDIDTIDSFIRTHRDVMRNIQSTFQHDDFHPANLIIQNDHLNGIVDFNRCDFGDPVHDFLKTGFFSRNISVPFSRGLVDGYFHKMIPSDFWQKYTLYVAMGIISDLVWSYRYDMRVGSDTELQKSIQRVTTAYHDHEGFRLGIPHWYSA